MKTSLEGDGWWDFMAEPTVYRCVDLFEQMVMEQDPHAGARLYGIDADALPSVSGEWWWTRCRHGMITDGDGPVDAVCSLRGQTGCACADFIEDRYWGWPKELLL